MLVDNTYLDRHISYLLVRCWGWIATSEWIVRWKSKPVGEMERVGIHVVEGHIHKVIHNVPKLSTILTVVIHNVMS